MEQTIVYLHPSEIKPYETNPRFNDDAVDFVANSIREFGFRQPIIVDKDKIVIAGHTRLKASLKLGLKKVPVIIATDMTEEQVKAYRLADNKVSEYSSWDFDLLPLEMGEIEIDMSDFGFKSFTEDFDTSTEPLDVAPASSEKSEKDYFTVTLKFPTTVEGMIRKHIKDRTSDGFIMEIVQMVKEVS